MEEDRTSYSRAVDYTHTCIHAAHTHTHTPIKKIKRQTADNRTRFALHYNPHLRLSSLASDSCSWDGERGFGQKCGGGTVHLVFTVHLQIRNGRLRSDRKMRERDRDRSATTFLCKTDHKSRITEKQKKADSREEFVPDKAVTPSPSILGRITRSR